MWAQQRGELGASRARSEPEASEDRRARILWRRPAPGGEEEVEEEEGVEEVEIGLESLADKHGLEKVIEVANRMSKKG